MPSDGTGGVGSGGGAGAPLTWLFMLSVCVSQGHIRRRRKFLPRV